MGCINYIYKPKDWKIVLEGPSRIVKDDYIYQMIIGTFDDEITSGNIYEFISKENYEKILTGTYELEIFPYSEQKIVLFDIYDNIIPLVKGYDKVKKLKR